MKFKSFICIGLGLGISISAYSDPIEFTESITVAASTDASLLASALASSKVHINNATLKCAPIDLCFSAGLYENASFLSQNNSYLRNGIVLSSGNVGSLNTHYNDDDGITGSWSEDIDQDETDLKSLFNIITTDVTALEFDLTYEGDPNSQYNVSFWYIFGSDEYDEYANDIYYDAFGFFVNGKNIATIPGTTTPVSINTINADFNSSYYNDNDKDSEKGAIYPTEMDGFTVPLSAQFSVYGQKSYHIKLVIADGIGTELDPYAFDCSYDSWVLIGANSFHVTPLGVPEPSVLGLLGSGLTFLLIGLAYRKK